MTAALLAGRPILNSSPVSWSLQSGTDPVVRTFDFSVSDAEFLLAEGQKLQPVTLNIAGSEFTNLWILGRAPGPNRHIGRIRVADRRWFWPYIHILRRYNVRRNVGFNRLRAPNAPDEVEPVQDDVWYAKWSLKNPDAFGAEGKWRAEDVLDDVLFAIRQAEKDITGLAPRSLTTASDFDFANAVSVENLVIDDPAPQSLSRVLGYFPEIDIYLNEVGDIVVYARTDGSEAETISTGGFETFGGGHVEFIDRSIESPKAVDVLFSYLCELRFDAVEGEGVPPLASSGPLAQFLVHGGLRDVRQLLNVLPNPDFTLRVGDEDVPMGAYITFDQFFEAVPRTPSGAILDNVAVRRTFSPFKDLWAVLRMTGFRVFDSDWGARAGAIESHFRQTYQLNPVWMDRILALRDTRVAILNPELGTTGPSLAWSNFCVLGSQRSLARDFSNDADLAYAANVTGYPESDGDGIVNNDGTVPFLDEGMNASPFDVSIRHHDLGIIRFDPQGDKFRVYNQFLPSHLDNVPTGEVRTTQSRGLPGSPARSRPIGFDAVPRALGGRRSARPILSENHGIAVILSAIPAAPNNGNQLYRVRINASDPRLANKLPKAVAATVGESRGPVKEVRIGAGVEVARVAWDDEQAELIEEVFGKTNPTADEDDDRSLSERIQPLVINDVRVDSGGEFNLTSHLEEIALAVAARVYTRFASHHEGAASYNHNINVRPGGWISEVQHDVAADGAALTRVALPEDLPSLDFLSLLDNSTRAIILKEAIPKGSQ